MTIQTLPRTRVQIRSVADGDLPVSVRINDVELAQHIPAFDGLRVDGIPGGDRAGLRVQLTLVDVDLEIDGDRIDVVSR